MIDGVTCVSMFQLELRATRITFQRYGISVNPYHQKLTAAKEHILVGNLSQGT